MPRFALFDAPGVGFGFNAVLVMAPEQRRVEGQFALYVAGAIVYGLQRPDPIPAVFGYHEIFHAFVIAGAAVHFVAIAVYIIPGSPRA